MPTSISTKTIATNKIKKPSVLIPFREQKDKVLMSKGMGKVLDSKVVKKVAVPVGKAVIKTVKAPGKLMVNALQKEELMKKKQNEKWEMEGKMQNRAYSGLPTNVKIK